MTEPLRKGTRVVWTEDHGWNEGWLRRRVGTVLHTDGDWLSARPDDAGPPKFLRIAEVRVLEQEMSAVGEG